MSARQKLNSAVVTGAILIGGLVAAATNSSVYGLLAAIGLMIAGLRDGTYRAGRRPRQDHRRDRRWR